MKQVISKGPGASSGRCRRTLTPGAPAARWTPPRWSLGGLTRGFGPETGCRLNDSTRILMINPVSPALAITPPWQGLSLTPPSLRGAHLPLGGKVWNAPRPPPASGTLPGPGPPGGQKWGSRGALRQAGESSRLKRRGPGTITLGASLWILFPLLWQLGRGHRCEATHSCH